MIVRKTAVNWAALNPVLPEGVFGFETGTNRFKMGDGKTPWSALVYYAPEVTIVGHIQAASSTAISVASLENVPAGTPAGTPVFVRS